MIFPDLVADAPARALMACFSQFNGKNGCGKCLHTGERVVQGAGTAQVYPLDHPLPQYRTHEQSLDFAIMAETEKTGSVSGVKGLSLLYSIPKFNIVTGVLPEIMHALYLGVCRQFESLWFSNVSAPYYIQNYGELDSILMTARVPDEILRLPREFAKYGAKWKASEQRNFLLFYSCLVLHSVLPSAYYKHWLLLVNAFRIILRKSVSKPNIQITKLLI